MTQTPTEALRLVEKAIMDQPGVRQANSYGEICVQQIANAVLRVMGAAPASPLPGGGDILWMMHVRGPDDIYPAPDYETAVAWCDYVNDVLAKAVPEVMTKAVPAIWTGTPESHADGLPDAIKGWTLPAAPTGDA